MSSPTEQEGEISTPNVLKLSSDLRPLMFWMSNATELLNFFQVKVESMEKEWEFEGESHLRTIQRDDSQWWSKQNFGNLGQKSKAENLSFLFMIVSRKPRGTHFWRLTWTPVQKLWHSWMMSLCTPSSSVCITSPRYSLKNKTIVVPQVHAT